MFVSTRKAAFGIHFSISLLILILLLAVIFFVWYPYDLIYAGGIDGLKILMGVDLILGPLLTLIVFKPGKKGLKLDLTLIGTLQILCLCYGLWMVHSQRPMVQVLIDDGVHLLSAADINQYQVDTEGLAGKTPKNVMMDLPEDQNSWGAIKFATELDENKPFSFRDDLYLPMGEVSQKKYDKRLDVVLQRNEDPKLQQLNSSGERCTWIPIISVHVTGYACHSYENGIEKLSDKKL